MRMSQGAASGCTERKQDNAGGSVVERFEASLQRSESTKQAQSTPGG